uniref:Uncharacterized protein n=1 Tax=Opuntia streptacantha TaxID=393608 RepID=A0A7C9EKV0_OPUST
MIPYHSGHRANDSKPVCYIHVHEEYSPILQILRIFWSKINCQSVYVNLSSVQHRPEVKVRLINLLLHRVAHLEINASTSLAKFLFPSTLNAIPAKLRSTQSNDLKKLNPESAEH